MHATRRPQRQGAIIDTQDSFRLYQVDTEGQLFISGEVTDWQPLAAAGITAVIDLDGKLDIGTPHVPNSVVYLFWPIDDRPELPDVPLLGAIARLGAFLLGQGHKVLCQCGMGYNRSALVAGLILVQRASRTQRQWSASVVKSPLVKNQ